MACLHSVVRRIAWSGLSGVELRWRRRHSRMRQGQCLQLRIIQPVVSGMGNTCRGLRCWCLRTVNRVELQKSGQGGIDCCMCLIGVVRSYMVFYGAGADHPAVLPVVLRHSRISLGWCDLLLVVCFQAKRRWSWSARRGCQVQKMVFMDLILSCGWFGLVAMDVLRTGAIEGGEASWRGYQCGREQALPLWAFCGG